MLIELTGPALKDLKKISKLDQDRIKTKLEFFASQKDPLVFAKPLARPDALGQFRFRVGDFRVIFDIENLETIVIVKVGHRKDIYKI